MQLPFADKPKPNCGVFGVFGSPFASTLTYYGLHALQHRGQEGAGIVSLEYDSTRGRSHFNIHRGLGLIADVFRDEAILTEHLKGIAAIGHNRYSTAGASNNPLNVQPFVVNYRDGNLAIAHNGNLTNFRALRNQLKEDGTIFQTTSDSEIILHLIARSREREQIRQILDALNTVRGAFSLVLLTDDKLIAARDPYGFRPLALGEKDGAYVVASETCAFDIIGATYIRDVNPGEVLVIDEEALRTRKPRTFQLAEKVPSPRYCIFEYIYFSRPDSKIFGENVDKIRRRIGKALAEEHPVEKAPDEKHLIVMSVPDSSNTATLGYVTRSVDQGINARFEIGLIRSHYVGRTFIQPDQDIRETQVKTKFNTVKGVLKGRRVVVVDDSIVRGTTSKLLVKLLRKAEPSEIHFRISSPPIRFPCHYGMDFPSREELIAVRKSGDVEGIREELGADSLKYLSLEKLLEVVPHGNGEGYCTACFSGEYPVPVDEELKKDENDI
jgi:amidophosphoribosyltransferase